MNTLITRSLFDLMNPFTGDMLHNEIKIDDKTRRLEIPVPGLSTEDLSITVEDNTLIVEAEHEEREDTEYLHQMFNRYFRSEFPLNRGWSVEGESYVRNGMLYVTLSKIQPSRIKINGQKDQSGEKESKGEGSREEDVSQESCCGENKEAGEGSS